MSVTSNHVIVASREAFYVWHFRTAQSWTTLRMESSKTNQQQQQQQNLSKIDRIYHVDDTPSGAVHSAQVSRKFKSKKNHSKMSLFSIKEP